VDPLEKALKGLVAGSLSEVIDRLAELTALRAKGEPVPLTRVTLHLRSGRDLQGLFLEVREHRTEPRTLVLRALSPDARRPEPDAIFIPASTLEAITVHDLPSVAQPPRGGPPPPTKLELRRKLAERQAALAATLGTPLELEVDWDRLPPEPEALAALDMLGTRGFSVLEELTRELMGIEALRTKVRKVRLAVGSASQVLLEEQSLLLVTALAFTGWMSKDDLRRAIEKVL
jgi:hypothetical protein